jgi:hypothetical protein
LAGTVENAIVFMMLFMYSVRWETILLYLAMMISIKIAPLWLLWNAPHPRTVATEVGLLCAVFAVYLFWLRVQNVNFITIYARTFDAIVSGTNQTPFFRLTTEVISSIRMVLSWLGFGTGGQQ